MAAKRLTKKQKEQAAKADILTSEIVVAPNDPTEFNTVVLEGVEQLDPMGIEEPVETPPAAPAKKDNKIKPRGELDAFGFGSDSQASFILAYLEDGTATKAEIIEAFCDHFRMDSAGKVTFDKTVGERDDVRKRSSLSVFFSDVAKPFGTYHAGRSLIILDDPKTRRLSLDPKRTALIKKVIADGILNSLKGFNFKKHPEKVAAVRKKFGVPQE